MARAKISEQAAKSILYGALGEAYGGISINAHDFDAAALAKLPADSYVVKVDQAVKKRNKLGLVHLNVSPKDVAKSIDEFKKQGYQWVLVEPFVAHDVADERFLAIERTANGITITCSEKGGVDVEENSQALQKFDLQAPYDLQPLQPAFPDTSQLAKLVACFEADHFTYLEINPYLFQDGKLLLLDAAVEVDTAGEFFVKGAWTSADIRNSKREIDPHEQAVEALAAKSPASLTFKVLNPNGTLFLLLSGGGASVVIADELSNLGYHDQIANYGEYSGNPSEEETYLYTKQIIGLLLASKAPQKILLIAGGTANFTDVAQTFKGIVRALQDDAAALKQQAVKVFVRRGGPNEKAGLQSMTAFLDAAGLNGGVYGSELPLSEIVSKATEGLNHD